MLFLIIATATQLLYISNLNCKLVTHSEKTLKKLISQEQSRHQKIITTIFIGYFAISVLSILLLPDYYSAISYFYVSLLLVSAFLLHFKEFVMF